MKTVLVSSISTFFIGTSLVLAQTPGVSEKEIKLGFIAPMTGASISFGKPITEGLQAYFNRLNQDGGINGRKVKLIRCDDGYEPSRTPDCFKTLISDNGVFGIVTLFGGPTTAAIIPLAESQKVPVFGAMTPAVFMPVNKHIFVVRPSAKNEMETVIDHLSKERGVKSFAMFYQDDAFGQNYLNFAQKALAARGTSLKARGAYIRNTTDVDSAVKAISEADPEVVLIGGLMPATAVFVQKYLATGKSPLFVGGGANSTLAFAKATEKSNAKYFGTVYAPPIADESSELVKKYKADMKASGFSEFQQYGVEAYLNATAFTDALKRAGAQPSRESFLQALEKTSDVSFGGVKLKFAPNDHQGLEEPFFVQQKGPDFIAIKSFKP